MDTVSIGLHKEISLERESLGGSTGHVPCCYPKQESSACDGVCALAPASHVATLSDIHSLAHLAFHRSNKVAPATGESSPGNRMQMPEVEKSS